MKTTTDLYLFRCITNLHAGSGDSNYGIVDKEVQRDPVDTFPIVHSTSLKGAFREQFDSLVQDHLMKQEDIDSIFGTDSKAEDVNPEKFRAGQYFFYPAQLLFYPVRSSIRPFFYATSNALIKKFIASQEDMGTNTSAVLEQQFKPLLTLNPARGFPLVFVADANNAFIDEYQAEKEKIQITIAPGVLPAGITLDNLALFYDDDLTDAYKRLPVVARNVLENGISANLWYEEFVPRESRFYFFVSRPDDGDGGDLFDKGLKLVNHKAQIGGNASVGYGLCELKRISGE